MARRAEAANPGTSAGKNQKDVSRREGRACCRGQTLAELTHEHLRAQMRLLEAWGLMGHAQGHMWRGERREPSGARLLGRTQRMCSAGGCWCARARQTPCCPQSAQRSPLQAGHPGSCALCLSCRTAQNNHKMFSFWICQA